MLHVNAGWQATSASVRELGDDGSVRYLREVASRKDTASANDQSGSVRRVEPATPKIILLDGLKERMTVALERGGEV
jgi:hypothetical protein